MSGGPEDAAYFVVPFEGGSMRPTLVAGDRLLCRRISAGDELRENDLAGFSRGGALVVHRVLAVGGGRARTRGDSALFPDRPVARERVHCVVAKAWRGGRELPLGRPSPAARLAWVVATAAGRWLRRLVQKADRNRPR